MTTTAFDFSSGGNADYPETAFFWDGLAEGKVLLPYCTLSEHHFFPPAPGCPQCGRDDHLESREASGTGTVYSWIVAHYAFEPEFRGDVPYVIAEVQLPEGPRVYTWLQDVAVDADLAGLDVTVEAAQRDGRTFLRSVPARP